MPVQLSRDEQVASFYRGHAERLRRAIGAKTGGVDSALVDDACAFAWEKLLRRRDLELERPQAYWWLYKVALRQAWALAQDHRREPPVGGLSGADADAPEPPSGEEEMAELVAQRIEHAAVRDVLGELHWRERRELLLYACGLSYDEIAEVTGTSYTAVNRWLTRGKRALRHARARCEGRP